MSNDSMKKIICEGYFNIPLKDFDTILAAYDAHVQLSREEPGNITYEYRLDDAIKGRIQITESYLNRQAFDDHLTRTKATNWPEISKDVIRHIDVKTGD